MNATTILAVEALWLILWSDLIFVDIVGIGILRNHAWLVWCCLWIKIRVNKGLVELIIVNIWLVNPSLFPLMLYWIFRFFFPLLSSFNFLLSLCPTYKDFTILNFSFFFILNPLRFISSTYHFSITSFAAIYFIGISTIWLVLVKFMNMLLWKVLVVKVHLLQIK